MTWHPTQSDFPDTEPNYPRPILIMSNSWLGSLGMSLYIIDLTRPGLEPMGSNLTIYQRGIWAINSFCHPVCSEPLVICEQKATWFSTTLVCARVRVCTNVCECVWRRVYESVYWCAWLWKYVWVCVSVCWCALVCTEVCVWVCLRVCVWSLCSYLCFHFYGNSWWRVSKWGTLHRWQTPNCNQSLLKAHHYVN